MEAHVDEIALNLIGSEFTVTVRHIYHEAHVWSWCDSFSKKFLITIICLICS